MASPSRLLSDPEEILSEQVREAQAFISWTEDERMNADSDLMCKLHQLADSCYSLALRNLSDHLIIHVPPGKPYLLKRH